MRKGDAEPGIPLSPCVKLWRFLFGYFLMVKYFSGTSTLVIPI